MRRIGYPASEARCHLKVPNACGWSRCFFSGYLWSRCWSAAACPTRAAGPQAARPYTSAVHPGPGLVLAVVVAGPEGGLTARRPLVAGRAVGVRAWVPAVPGEPAVFPTASGPGGGGVAGAGVVGPGV